MHTSNKQYTSSKSLSKDAEKEDKREDIEDKENIEEKPISKEINIPSSGWITKFLKRPGNEWLEEIERDFLNDFTNLVGLDAEISYMSQGYRAIMSDGLYLDSNGNSQICSKTEGKYLEAAETLYGLVHVRYLFTIKGMAKVFLKYKEGKYGVCPRHYCIKATALPIGISDKIGQGNVKVYCPSCEDVYHSCLPKNQTLDGAYFGMSLPQMFFMTYPLLRVQPSIGHYVPRLHGFGIHVSAKHIRCEPKEAKKTNKHNHKSTIKHSKPTSKADKLDDLKENDAAQDNKLTKLPQINGHGHDLPATEKTPRRRRRQKRTEEIKGTVI